MRKHVLSALVLVVVALACAGEASALVQRTFVSGLGSDANPCTRTEPCRTFARAMVETQAGGEVLALDTAGYGPVHIGKAISLISPPGVYAGITTTSFTSAIRVTAGANDEVVLKGLSLSGLGIGSFGIWFESGKALHVEGLTISGFVGDGILFSPTATARLSVTDSLIRSNGDQGIEVSAPVGQLARVTVDRTRLALNEWGLVASSNSRVIMRDSAVIGSTAAGVHASQSTAVVILENCLAADNNWGIHSSGVVRVAGTTVTENVFGLAVGAGGSIFSRGNNTVEGNGTNGTFTGFFAAK